MWVSTFRFRPRPSLDLNNPTSIFCSGGVEPCGFEFGPRQVAHLSNNQGIRSDKYGCYVKLFFAKKLIYSHRLICWMVLNND